MDLFKKILRIALIVSGCFFLLMLILSFTTLPFWMYYGLGAHDQKLTESPKNIVLLGAGGMPSSENFMRIHTTAMHANQYPMAKVIVALPGDTLDANSSINLMRDELILKGVSKHRIILENLGANTRSQTFETGKLISKTEALLVVTSIYHMKRSVGTFKKEGFTNVGSGNAYEQPLEGNLIYNDDELGDRGVIDVSENTQLRYQFWKHLQYELIVIREYTAIVYYKLKGWM